MEVKGNYDTPYEVVFANGQPAHTAIQNWESVEHQARITIAFAIQNNLFTATQIKRMDPAEGIEFVRKALFGTNTID